MSTLTGLIGGGGGEPVVTSWPSLGSWIVPANFSANITSTFTTILNISSGSGYLIGCHWVNTGTVSGIDVRFRLIVDGTTICDHTGAVDSTDTNIIFWPPVLVSQFRGTTPNANGLSPTAFPLRFESSLQVAIQEIGGNIGAVRGMYVLT